MRNSDYLGARPHDFVWNEEWSDDDESPSERDWRGRRRLGAPSPSLHSGPTFSVRQTNASLRRLKLRSERDGAHVERGAVESRREVPREGYGGRLGVRLAAHLSARCESGKRQEEGERERRGSALGGAPGKKAKSSREDEESDGGRSRSVSSEPREEGCSMACERRYCRGARNAPDEHVTFTSVAPPRRHARRASLSVSFGRADELDSDGPDGAWSVRPKLGSIRGSGARSSGKPGAFDAGVCEKSFEIGAETRSKIVPEFVARYAPASILAPSSFPAAPPPFAPMAVLPVQIAQTYTPLCETSGSGSASARSSAGSSAGRNAAPPPLPDIPQAKAPALEALHRALSDTVDRIPVEKTCGVGGGARAATTGRSSTSPAIAISARRLGSVVPGSAIFHHAGSSNPSLTASVAPDGGALRSARASVSVSVRPATRSSFETPVRASVASVVAAPASGADISSPLDRSQAPARTLLPIPPARTSPREVAECDRVIMANRLDASVPTARRGKGPPKGIEKAPGWLRVLVAAATEGREQ